MVTQDEHAAIPARHLARNFIDEEEQAP